MQKLLLLFLLLAGITCRSQAQGSWAAKSAFPGPGRSTSACFTIGSTGYVFAGQGTGGAYNDLWAYNAATDQWTQRASLPGAVRWFAVGVEAGGKAYAGTGRVLPSGGYSSGWYAYDPALDTWTPRAPVPGSPRSGPFAFTLGGLIYVGGGFSTSSALTDMWAYNPATDQWTARAAFPGGQHSAFGAFVLGGLGYVVGGYRFNSAGSNSDQLWAYDPTTDQWTQKASLPATRGSMASFALGGLGYVSCGVSGIPNGTLYNTTLAYDPVANSWLARPALPSTVRFGPVGFVINNKAYVGLGSTGANEWWEYTPATAMGQQASLANTGLAYWPTPSQGQLHLTSNSAGTAQLYDACGRLVRTWEMPAGASTADLSNLPAGTYVLRCGTVVRRVVLDTH